MDRLELRKKFSSRIEKVRLESYDMELHIRPLSALERARTFDRYRELNKGQDAQSMFETMTKEAQCYIASRGLVDDSGAQIYKNDEAEALAEEIPGDALDLIVKDILHISGMDKSEDAAKNSTPTLSAAFSSALQ